MEEDGTTVTRQRKAVETLISASKERQDNKFQKYYLKDKESVNVHAKCYKLYTNEDTIKACKIRREAQFASTSTRASSSTFDFTENCLFCGKDAGEKFIKKEAKKGKRAPVRNVTSDELQTTILSKAGERSDRWSREVLNRVASVTSLIAVQARYHNACYLRLLHPSSDTDQTLENAPHILDLIESFIKDHPDETNFSLGQIIAKYEGEVANKQWLKKKLYERLGNDIMITSNHGSQPIIYVRNACNQILLENFRNSENVESDRFQIVRAAAKIIIQDIRAQEYDTETYPSPNFFFENVEKVIPNTLRMFLDTVVVSDKRGTDSSNKFLSKIVGIAHAVISCVRPRSFISSMKIGLGAVLNKKFGSKSLLNILSALGFCCTYDEALLFEASVVSAPHNVDIDPESFSQFVFDNADHNVNTIDGLHTFHAMGGIECVTPASAVSCDFKVPKLKAIPPRDTLGSYGTLPLKVFHGYKKAGLGNVPITDLDLMNPNFSYDFDMSSTDLLWIYNHKVRSIDVKGWNGFMENLTQDLPYTRSRILYLPCLNHPPSNYDTIYTVLSLAAERIENKKQKVAIVTFDQPLYWKANEILHSTTDPKLKNVVVRLGGFHLIMSFLGSIGQIMDGSGLKELFSVFYASASVDKMLAGHAYSRAVRAHILVHCALVQVILGSTNFTDEESSKLTALLEESTDVFATIDTDLEFQNIKVKFMETLRNFSGKSETAKLWIQYVQMVSLLKMFIEAEKSGNWQLHLDTVQKMLPFFHASGHFLYAKSAHLYLQDMYNLKERMDEAEYEQFVNGGFTIRRTDKFWSGIWSDMTIEQFLMKAFKDIGGPTRGRGMTDSVISKWLMSTPALIDLLDALAEFCNVFLATTEQHVDARATRIARDIGDIGKILQWLADHNPFPETEGLISLSTGVKCSKNDNINCHEALEVGLRCMGEMMKVGSDGIQKCFGTLKYKRRDKVIPLKALVSSVKVSDTPVPIDPLLLFQRICVLKKSDDDLEAHLAHEMAPVPLAMFNEKGFRKNVKSKLYDSFEPIDPPVRESDNLIYVIDGGFLLHKVGWHQKETFHDILTRYIDYLTRNYSKNCIVVFDGYPEGGEGKYTKSAERSRRATLISAPEVVCATNMPSALPQDKFLSNQKNKLHLIGILTDRLRKEGFLVEQAVEDADTLIINTAIGISDNYESVYVVGEDVDLLVILSQIAKQKKNIYLLKPSRGNIEQKIYSVDSFKYPEIQHLICFIHAFTGCDTTSALYKQGKSKLMRLLKNSSTLRSHAEVFNENYASQDELSEAGGKIVLALYGAKDKDNDTLVGFRYKCFIKASLKKNFDLSILPPTEDALKEHCLRSYLQTRVWQGDDFRDPMEWGWKKSNNTLTPIMMRNDPIPASLLELISCGCDKSNCSGSRCSCRKVGLKCTVLCKTCSGKNCSNVDEPDIGLSDDEQIDGDLLRLNAEGDDDAALGCSYIDFDESEPVAKRPKVS